MIEIYQKTIKSSALAKIDSCKPGSFIYALSPTKEELEKMSQDFNLDLGLLNDAVDPNEVPRMEYRNNIAYIFTRVPIHENGGAITMPILIILSETYLALITKHQPPFMETFLQEKIDFCTTQKIKMFTQIFSEINSLYYNFLNEINKKARHIISLNPHRIDNEDILRLVKYENMLNDFLSALIPTNTILQNILSGKFFKLFPEDQDLIEDMFLLNGQLLELSKSNLHTIESIRSGYSTILSNNLNRIMKILTAWTIILTIPTMVSSFFGMNIALPLQDHPLAFFLVIMICLISCTGVIWFFTKSKWM